MREVGLEDPCSASEASTLTACLATILELPLADVPEPPAGEDAVAWRTRRWLGGLGLGLIPVTDAGSFSWNGPWIGWVRPAGGGERRAVVMYGVPSGVAWDPSAVTEGDGWEIEGGLVVAALDVALARPPLPEAPASPGTVEG